MIIMNAPKLYKTIFELKYSPMLSYFNKLVTIAEKIDGYPDWETDLHSVVLMNFEKHCSLAIKFDSFNYAQDSSESYLEESNIDAVLALVPKEFGIKEFKRFHVRKKYLTTVSSSYEEIVKISNIKLFSQGLRHFMPDKISDVAYIANYEDDHFKYKINIGPTFRQQTNELIRFEQSRHLHPKNRSHKFLEVINGYPEISLYIDISIDRDDKSFSLNETKEYLSEANKIFEELPININNYIFKKDLR